MANRNVLLWIFLSLVTTSSGCFPCDTQFDIADTQISVSTITRDQSWCSSERKGERCDEQVYSLDPLRQDYEKMVDDSAKMVRIYGPICEQEMVWNNVIQATAKNNLLEENLDVLRFRFRVLVACLVLFGLVWI